MYVGITAFFIWVLAGVALTVYFKQRYPKHYRPWGYKQHLVAVLAWPTLAYAIYIARKRNVK